MCSYTWMVSLFACLTLTLTYLLYFTFLLDPRFTFLRNGATFQLTWSLLENNYKSCTGNVMHHVMYTEQLWWGVYLFDHFNNLRVGIITIVITVIVSGSFILAVRVSGTSNLNNGEQWTMLNNGDTMPVSNIETTLNQRCATSIQRFFCVAQHRFNFVSTWAQHQWRRILWDREREESESARERASDREREWEQERAIFYSL